MRKRWFFWKGRVEVSYWPGDWALFFIRGKTGYALTIGPWSFWLAR